MLQANTIANPRDSLQMDAFFHDIPKLQQLKLNTEGNVFVGNGHPNWTPLLPGHLYDKGNTTAAR
jgi:hypothetical protein